MITLRTLLTIALIALALPAWGQRRPDGELELQFVDGKSKAALPVRMQLRNAAGKNAAARGMGTAAHGTHFYADGSIVLPLRKGGYMFDMEAGTEFKTQSGHFEIERHADDSKQVVFERFATLEDEGWFAGDVDVNRPCKGMDVAEAAEGLWYVPLVAYTWTDGKWEVAEKIAGNEFPKARDGRVLERSVVEVNTPGGRLICVAPAPLTEAPTWKPATSVATIAAAKAADYKVLAGSPTENDFPLWLASEQLDGVILWGDYSPLKGPTVKARDKAPRREPDKTFFAGPQGAGRWHEAIYFHMLNAGLRIAPLAASHSGASPVPLGSARTYVHCEDFNRDAWWEQALAGASVLSTGPLLRPQVGGDPPGQTFATTKAAPVEFSIALNLATRTPVDYFEILRNGEVATEVRLAEWAAAGGKLPPIGFAESGWFALRGVTNNRDRYDLALSAPYFVDDGTGPRVSRKACEFFVSWLEELKSSDADEVTKARAWWQARRDAARAD